MTEQECLCDIECIEDSFSVYCVIGDRCDCKSSDCDLHEELK